MRSRSRGTVSVRGDARDLVAAQAKLEAEGQRAAQTLSDKDRALSATLRQLATFEGMPACVHRIARAVLEDRLAPFERTLLEQLGTNAGLGAHFAHWGYAGPLVFAHDSTAARPYADVRVIDQGHVEVDCFVSGPVRRQSVEIDDLQAGQRGFVLKSDLISFVARDITWRASTIWIPSLPMTGTPLCNTTEISCVPRQSCRCQQRSALNLLSARCISPFTRAC